MNEEAMRKHYERTPKETLINILISSREQLEKLQKRNKERKQETERLNNIINEFDKWLEEESEKENYSVGHLTCLMMSKVKLQELKDSDKG